MLPMTQIDFNEKINVHSCFPNNMHYRCISDSLYVQYIGYSSSVRGIMLFFWTPFSGVISLFFRSLENNLFLCAFIRHHISTSSSFIGC